MKRTIIDTPLNDRTHLDEYETKIGAIAATAAAHCYIPYFAHAQFVRCLTWAWWDMLLTLVEFYC